MGAVAAELADTAIITSDNPRTEEPEAIIKEILAGIGPKQMSRVVVEPDRAKAIAAAIDSAESGDIIVIAGKGHETYQTIGKENFPFDDRLIARQAMTRRSQG